MQTYFFCFPPLNKADLHGYSNAHVCFCEIGAVEPVKFYFPYLQLLPEQIYLLLHLKHYCRRLIGLKEDFLLQTLQPGMNQSGGMYVITDDNVMCSKWNKFLLLYRCSSPTFSPWMTSQSPELLRAPHLRLQQKKEGKTGSFS